LRSLPGEKSEQDDKELVERRRTKRQLVEKKRRMSRKERRDWGKGDTKKEKNRE